MTKSAVLVGCNYANHARAALRGCINDVSTMYELLVARFGFPGENITVLIDSRDPLPTGVNIKNALTKMVTSAQPGDILFFHFSGHGVQVESEDPTESEIDGKDECIVPCDFNLIVDNDLKAIVDKVPGGAMFTMVCDCCHSGTMLDGKNVVIEGLKEEAQQGLLSMLLSAALAKGRSIDLQTDKVEVVNRALPLPVLHDILSQKIGHDVERGNVHLSLAEMFGKDSSRASLRLKRIVDRIDKRLGGKLGRLFKTKRNGDDRERGLFSSVKKFIHEAFASDGGSNASHCSAKDIDGDGDGDGDGDSEDRNIHINVDVPVLITGCQSDEVAADAYPSEDKTKAFGALTNAISIVMATYPGGLSNQNLVLSVREYLKAQGFAQNPCLECANENAVIPFIC